MPTFPAALDGLAASLAQRDEVRRFKQAQARIAADPESSKALQAFITECYTRARAAGISVPTPADTHWLTARKQVACRNSLVKEYLDAHEGVLRILQIIQSAINDQVVQPGR